MSDSTCLASATSADFARVLPLLSLFEQGSPHLGREHWQRLFDYPWEAPSPVRGLILTHEGEAVGFEACILKERNLNGSKHWIGNHSSWVVKPEHRSSSLQFRGGWGELMSSCENFTSVTHSTQLRLQPIFHAFGFETLEDHLWVLFPIPVLPLGSWRVTADPEVLRSRLSPHDWEIYKDHRSLDCYHHMAWKGDDYCYVVATRRPGLRNLPSANLLYISHPEIFPRCRFHLHQSLCLRHRVVWMTIDGRWTLGRRPIAAKKVPLSTPRLFKSGVLKAHQIDNLYSEFVLLDL